MNALKTLERLNSKNKGEAVRKEFLHINMLKEAFFKGKDLDVSECWNYMKKVRGAALCSTCAADSSQFFKSGKALIDLGECQNMLSKCKSHFAFIVDFVNDLEAIQVLINMNPSTAANSNTLKAIEPLIVKVKTQLKKNEKIWKLLKAPNLDAKQQIELCDNSFMLNKTPLIIALAPMFGINAEYIISQLFALMASQGRKLKSGDQSQSGLHQGSNWNVEQDILIFGGDVWAGLGPHELDQGKPMNLSMIFP